MTQAIDKEQIIIDEVKKLPPDKLDEVIDFIQLLQYKEKQKQDVEHKEEKEPISAYEAAKEFAGCVGGGPGDLATNKKYLEGIGEIPNSWEVVTLEDMCLKIVDCPHSTPKLSPTGIRTAKNVNVRNGRFIFEPAFYTTDEEYTERTKRLEPKEGDVLFSREAPIGEACLVPPNIKLSLGQRLMLLRTNPEKLNNFFLVQVFYSNYLKSKMISLAGGVTAPHLNVSHVKKLKIPLPYISEQHEIANILKACDRKIQALEKEIALTDELFHAMLEQLMTGKISTQPLTETYV